MPVIFNTSDVWAAGWPSKIKGGYVLESQVDVVQDGDEADFTWHGTIKLFVQPYGSRNVWACSDFATFSIGDTPFTELDSNGTFYGWAYEHPLPWPGDRSKYGGDPIRGTGDFLMQFRCDTSRYGNPNAVSLWTSTGGLVVDKNMNQPPGWGNVTTDNYWNYMGMDKPASAEISFSMSFHLHLTEDPEQIVVYANDSGSNSSYDHSWFNRRRVVWVRQFMDIGEITFDYRPGERKVQGVWQSHNREDGGVCERKNGGWEELRTRQGDKNAQGDPPEIKRSNDWYNMKKIGANAG